MSFLDKLEKKFGRFAIPHLMRYIIAAYTMGYVLYFTGQEDILRLFSLDASKLLSGQIWRVITFIIQPPNSATPIFFLLTLYFYFVIGRFLENVWGSFKFNLYFFSGVFLNVVASIVIYLVFHNIFYMSVFYINMALFMAFAFEQPNSFVLLFFVVPFKIKWLAYLDGIYIAMNIILGFLSSVVDFGAGFSRIAYTFDIKLSPENATAASIAMLNFIIYMILYKKSTKTFSHKAKKEYKYDYEAKAKPVKEARHKCAVCGVTELDDENEIFRYCSKCTDKDGNIAYEYCSKHLNNHEHKNG